MRFILIFLVLPSVTLAAPLIQPESLSLWIESISQVEIAAGYPLEIKGLTLDATGTGTAQTRSSVFYENSAEQAGLFAREYICMDSSCARVDGVPKSATLTPPSKDSGTEHSEGREIQQLTFQLSLSALLDAIAKVKRIPGQGRIFSEAVRHVSVWLERHSISVALQSLVPEKGEYFFFFQCHFHGEGAAEKVSCHRRNARGGSEPILHSSLQPRVTP